MKSFDRIKDLDRIYELSKEIGEREKELAEYRNENLYNAAPKSQIISDMPRGGVPKNDIEEYFIHEEEKRNVIISLYDKINILWLLFNWNYEDRGLTKRERDLLKNRFFYGHSWGICAKRMKYQYPCEVWNNNKVFRVYRSILHKLKNNNCA